MLGSAMKYADVNCQQCSVWSRQWWKGAGEASRLRVPSGGQSLPLSMQQAVQIFWDVGLAQGMGATRWQSLVTQHATCCAGPGGQRSITEGNGLRLTVLFTLAEFGCLLCRTLYRGIWTVLQHIQKEGSWTEADCQGAGPGDQHVGAAK